MVSGMLQLQLGIQAVRLWFTTCSLLMIRGECHFSFASLTGISEDALVSAYMYNRLAIYCNKWFLCFQFVRLCCDILWGSGSYKAIGIQWVFHVSISIWLGLPGFPLPGPEQQSHLCCVVINASIIFCCVGVFFPFTFLSSHSYYGLSLRLERPCGSHVYWDPPGLLVGGSLRIGIEVWM